MQAYLSKALWRAGTKLTLGLAVVGALVGIRIVTATPTGVEGEIAELERFEAEMAAGDEVGDAESASDPLTSDAGTASPDARELDRSLDRSLDRMVRCIAGGSAQYMRAADCATRGGDLEELPPPEPEAGDTPAES